MAPVNDAPTGELGNAGVIGYALPTSTPGAARTYGVDSLEETPDLRFPISVAVYDRMRRTDGQVGSVLRAITLAVASARWRLEGADVRPEVMDTVRAELGLDDLTARARRRRQGIVWKQHLREALAMLPLGFMPFEQVYELGPPAPGLTAPPGTAGEVAHLRKLAPRPPRTLIDVTVGADGGLAGVIQQPPPGATNRLNITGVPIPVDRLVMYVNEREGADWYGTSILRQAYPSWLIKDRLRRLGPMIVERNGMGLPIVEYDPQAGGTRTRALEIAKSARAGDEAGAALPTGYRFHLMGVQGNTRDELPLLKYHDEEIGRSALTMFLNLGHDNGARALGDTFLDFFLLSTDTVVDNVAETATEHVIRDLVEYNYGPEEPYPVLTADPLSADAAVDSGALKNLADAGLLTPDGTLEADLRRRHKLPSKPTTPGLDDTPVEEPSVEEVPPGYPGAYPTAAADDTDQLAARLESATRTLTAMRRHRA